MSKKALSLIVMFFVLFSGVLLAREIAVKTVKIETRSFLDYLQVQGNVDSIRTAKVSARIPGTIETMFVEEGDYVEAGKTKLFQIDSVKLLTNLEIRKQEHSIALFSLKEKEARFKQVQADLEKAQVDMNRYRLLWEDNSISKDDFEKVQLKAKVSIANLEHIQAIVGLSGEQLKQADLAVRIAEKDFSDSLVYAPISGRIASRLQEYGEMAAPGIPIMIIKDLSEIEVLAFLPDAYYHRVIPDVTELIVTTSDGNEEKMCVAYKSSVINQNLRTFQIKCRSVKPSNTLIPGQLAEMKIILNKQSGLSVPTSSIIQRGGEKVVFIVDGSKAKMISVKTGLENDGHTEIYADNIKAGHQVIIYGQHFLNDNQAILVKDGDI